jgi:hypothetical protein
VHFHFSFFFVVYYINFAMSAQWVFGRHADLADQPYNNMCKNQEGWVIE